MLQHCYSKVPLLIYNIVTMNNSTYDSGDGEIRRLSLIPQLVKKVKKCEKILQDITLMEKVSVGQMIAKDAIQISQKMYCVFFIS